MHAQLEIEVKWRLTGREYSCAAARLPRLLGPGIGLVQSNRFYDSSDGRLRRAGLACRLRVAGHRAWLTCKSRPVSGSSQLLATHQLPAGTQRSLEHEVELSLGEAARLAAESAALSQRLPASWRAALGSVALADIGGFRNYRREWRSAAALICLDRTDFGARTDHEVELECTDPVTTAAYWRRHFTAWGIAVRPQALSKAVRMKLLQR